MILRRSASVRWRGDGRWPVSGRGSLSAGVCLAAWPTSRRSWPPSSRATQAAAEQLLPLVYDELRKLAAARLAAGEAGPDAPAHRPGPRGVPPAGRRRPGQDWNGRGHFFAAAAEAMRRILVETARRKARREARRRRGAGRPATRPTPSPRPRRTTCWPSTRPSTGWRRHDPAGGRAGQAPVLRRADHGRGGRRRSASPAARPTATGRSPGPGCSSAIGGREPASEYISNIRGTFAPRWRTVWSRTRSRSTPWPTPTDARDRSSPRRRAAPPDRAGGVFLDGLRRRREPAGRRSRRCSRPTTEAGSFLGVAAGPRTADRRPADRRRDGPGTRHRPVQAAGADRRGRHGHGLDGRADRAGQAPGRRQAHQAGHGLAGR